MNRSIFKNMKISHKVAFSHALLFLLLQIFICSILLYTIRRYYPVEASSQVQTLINEVSRNAISYTKPLKDAPIKEIIPSIPSERRVYIRIIDLNGSILAEYGEADVNLRIEPPYNKVIRKNAKGIHLVYCNSLITRNNREDVLLQVAIDITQHLEFNTTLFKVVLLLTILGFSISIFTGFIVSKVVLKPVSSIIKTAKKINSDNLHVRIATNNAKDELNELSITLNSMVDRLQDSIEKQKQLISDVSHELRTPISVVKGYASLLGRWGKEDRNVMEESVFRINKEAENMAIIVDDLLLLARKDSGTLNLEKINFNMNELIDEVIDETKTIAPRCDISSSRNDTFQYFGDYRLIKQMLRILVDNSIKYSDKQCVVRINSILKGNSARISVEDMGIGIPKNELEKIFDRFYRIDKARTRSNKGCGLGLSIAKGIAEAHNGKIKAESEPGKGTGITVELPNILKLY